MLMGSAHIKEYHKYRYGDYMQLPPEEKRRAAVHAYYYNTERDYSEYVGRKGI